MVIECSVSVPPAPPSSAAAVETVKINSPCGRNAAEERRQRSRKMCIRDRDAAEYTFIRTYKPIDDRIGDIAYIQWGDGYAFIVNNTNCKSVRFTSGNEVYEEVIPDDTYPYVFFYLSDHTNSTLQFEFLDAEGNELR